jgi:alpha-tubulin suppressor-like RCC1 family protein
MILENTKHKLLRATFNLKIRKIIKFFQYYRIKKILEKLIKEPIKATYKNNSIKWCFFGKYLYVFKKENFQLFLMLTKKFSFLLTFVFVFPLVLSSCVVNARETTNDELPPIIQILGLDFITIEHGDIYIEQGALVLDNIDEDLEVIVEGEVNSLVPGTYIIKYSATDRSGNIALEKTRTVIVTGSNKDTVKPRIKLNGESSINIEFKSSFNDPLAIVTDDKDAEVKLLVSGFVNTEVLGTYLIRYNAIDNSGNRAEEVIRNVRVVDTTKPLVSLIGDSTVRVQFGKTYNEQGINVSDNHDDSSKIQISIGGLENLSNIGNHVLTYIATDSSGNISDEVKRDIIVENSTLSIVPNISKSAKHNGYVSSAGSVYMWGLNTSGQLGDYTFIDKKVPVDISSWFNLPSNEKINFLSLGDQHTSALSSAGRVFIWGANSNGQLGNGTRYPYIEPNDITANFYLQKNERIINLVMGGASSYALSSFGRVFSWGKNDFGQLGNGESTIDSLLPVDISSKFKLDSNDIIIGISMGSVHSSAISYRGRVFTWGQNGNGQLGNGDQRNFQDPNEITSKFKLLNDEIIVRISVAGSSSFALSSSGRAFAWGAEYVPGGIANKILPSDITNKFTISNNDKIIIINPFSAISSSGRVFTWGQNGYNEITNKFNLSSIDKIKIINTGFALSTLGRLFTWGANDTGQLGSGVEYGYLTEPTEIYLP